MGTLDCTTDPSACTYRPPTNAAGYTLFRYTVSDPAGREDTATVRLYVNSYGHAPTAVNDVFTTTMNTPKVFTVQDIVQNDIDADGDTLTVALQTGARAFGSLACSTPMYTCTYTPNPGFVGVDRFSYMASDSINAASTAAISVLTLPPSTPTFDAREDVIVTLVNQAAFVSRALLTSNDYAPSGGPVTITSFDTTGLVGTLSCDGTGCTYTPPFAFQGATTFKYTSNDGHGATDTAIVKIRVGGTNTAPVAVADTLSTAKNTVLEFSVFDLLRNDYDVDNDPLTVTVYGATAHLGTLNCGTPNYWCTYTPNANATGADVITYVLGDGTTLNHDVYFDAVGSFGAQVKSPAIGFSILGHELAHVMQYDLMGRPLFALVYAANYISNRESGKNDQESYRAIVQETMASNVELLMNGFLNQHPGIASKLSKGEALTEGELSTASDAIGQALPPGYIFIQGFLVRVQPPKKPKPH